MATKILIDTRNNKFIQFESKEDKKNRIEYKLDNYDAQHTAFLLSYTPINKWTINTEIDYYIDLKRAVRENLPDEQYKLVINEFAGSKKADQPLPIKGTWECSFVK